MAEQLTTLVPPALQRLRRLWESRQPDGANSEAASRTNIRAHYDLSNELFRLFLDDSLTYSSAVFAELPARWEQLERAQHAKIDRLLDLAGVGPGSRVLEIGTGWGELCIRAARRGATVLSLTLSQEQHDLALDRVRAAGVADAVEIRLQDYRRLDPVRDGRFDAVVSVEMIEAVGVAYWPTYFRTLDSVLAPRGRVALQAITMPHDRLLATRRTYTWIHKYIFPGGMLPSNEAIDEATRAHTRLRVTGGNGFGQHYAETLRLWRERFTAHADEVDGLGFDEAFRRMWTLYLAYSEAGFRSGYLDVRQILLTRVEQA
jgi:cyclopropane-fatty-acyl-phospholipid synthase